MSDPRPNSDSGTVHHHVHVGHAGKHGPHDPEAHRMAETKSTPALLGDLINHATELFRKEVMLARAEVSEKINQATAAGVMLGAGLVLGIVGLIYLAGAAVLGLIALGLNPGWAVLIVGGLLSLIALMMALSGKKKLNARNLTPHRTVGSLSKDARVAKERVK